MFDFPDLGGENEALPRQFVTDLELKTRLLQTGARPSFRLMTSTLKLTQLLATPVASRDIAWELGLLQELPKASVRVVEDTPVAGPDGWPYLMLETGGDNPLPEIAKWLSSRGVGFVLNPEKTIA